VQIVFTYPPEQRKGERVGVMSLGAHWNLGVRVMWQQRPLLQVSVQPKAL